MMLRRKGRSEAVAWAHERGVQLRLIDPGKPNQNAYIESFQRKASR